ncbi:hypothetical protein D6745_01850 [Candidatus Woesearchaeota archaeon]|nr:MAG: hypothetical protein D6745_01850 [Candidatus Woesearchaeota archaeon]
MKKENKKLLFAGGIAGIIASLCCLGPVILVLLGLAGVSTALSIGKFTWLFTTLALIFFGAAVFLYLTRKKCCNIRGMKENWKPIIVSFLVLVVFLILLKYWLAPLLAKLAYR